MGEKASSLRVKRLSDLIHGASINSPVSNRASVSATFTNDEGSELVFTRSIVGTSSEYRVNNEIVPAQEYLQELVNLGINVNSKNFLVFQGAVESIAMKSAKERTTLFEEISGSADNKKEYDALLEEMKASEETTQFCYQKKKTIDLERKEATMEKNEAERYQKLQEDRDQRQANLQLFKLYHAEKKISKYEIEINNTIDSLKEVKTMSKEAERKLEETKKDKSKAMRDFTKVDSNIREKENALQKKKPAF